jgi:hypothetical protein
MGCRGHTEWPARLPDFTPLEFFLRGQLKPRLYHNQSHSTDKLENRTVDWFPNITHCMSCHVTISVEKNDEKYTITKILGCTACV